MANEGIAGALLLAIGGTILSALHYELTLLVYSNVLLGSGFDPMILVIIFGFLGFLSWVLVCG